MPPPPSFDCYAELQVERSASWLEINSAYRRLARIHHPDKNPDNQQEATTIFQRLQLAHETLSDPAKRAHYDNSPPGDWSPSFSQDDDDPWEDEDDPFGFGPFFFSFLFTPFFASPIFPGSTPGGASQGQAAYEDLEYERRLRENKRREEEARELREKEQRQRREAHEAREKAAERTTALARICLRSAELKKQEKRWEDNGAISKDERLRTCLHSEVCDKVQHIKKFKCTACSAKRGMIAFKCPHCSALLCQLCVTNFTARRMKLEIQERMEKQVTPEDSAGVSGKPNINKPDATKATTGTSATKKHKKKKKSSTEQSSNQTSKESSSGTSGHSKKGILERDQGLSEADENEAAPTSGGQFASDNPFNILAGDDQNTTLTSVKYVPDVSTSAQNAAPLTPARPDDIKGDEEKPASAKLGQSKKKRQNKKSANSYGGKENVKPNGKNQQANTNIGVEPKATSATHNTHRQAVAPGSSGFSYQDAGAENVSKNIAKDDMKTNASVLPQKPASHNVPSRQQDPTGSGRGHMPASTGAYVRTLGQAHSPTVSILRQAMEKFGAVKSLRIINKRNGTAHIDFAAHGGLCRAMAASPVVVSEQVTVRVVEWRHYGTSGKAGHVAQSFRDAKSKGPN
ncbi:putative meiotically up-regulated 185 protein [Diaporthe ampelina]|uniref:Putative meiotically up-regulated 185 protein n=1 Tax=Diaporthe ampelina TaxID=1214573 RepID=A0A0G2FEM2_9PEZI|nr:putative meiotically up-regulated 185 protein [Diaporthe ampelina]